MKTRCPCAKPSISEITCFHTKYVLIRRFSLLLPTVCAVYERTLCLASQTDTTCCSCLYDLISLAHPTLKFQTSAGL